MGVGEQGGVDRPCAWRAIGIQMVGSVGLGLPGSMCEWSWGSEKSFFCYSKGPALQALPCSVSLGPVYPQRGQLDGVPASVLPCDLFLLVPGGAGSSWSPGLGGWAGRSGPLTLTSAWLPGS